MNEKLPSDALPGCMLPDGAEPCDEYQAHQTCEHMTECDGGTMSNADKQQIPRAQLLACIGCGNIGDGIRRCCPDQKMIDAQTVIHQLWDIVYPFWRTLSGGRSSPAVGHSSEPEKQA